MMYGFTPSSLNSDLVALQYGQYDLEKTATALSSMMPWALVLAADMAAGLEARALLKKERRKFVMGGRVWEVREEDAVAGGWKDGYLVVGCGRCDRNEMFWKVFPPASMIAMTSRKLKPRDLIYPPATARSDFISRVRLNIGH